MINSDTLSFQVTVILITHNGAKRGFLREAIESVINQSYRFLEFIIVDDGSTDHTTEIVHSYLSQHQIKYFYQSNQGPSAARNTGIAHATSEYICFLDDDDIYEPNMVETLLNNWKDHTDPSCGLIYGAVREIDQSGSYIRDKFVEKNGDLYEDLLWRNFISCPSALMTKKSVFEDVGFFRQDLQYCEDYEMWLRISKKYKIFSIPGCIACYRIHQNNLSHHFDRMQINHKKVLDEQFNNADENILKRKNAYYHFFYSCCAAQYLGNYRYSDFRRQYHLAKSYGTLSFKWTIKYYLSFFPKVFSLLRRMSQSNVKNVIYAGRNVNV